MMEGGDYINHNAPDRQGTNFTEADLNGGNNFFSEK